MKYFLPLLQTVFVLWDIFLLYLWILGFVTIQYIEIIFYDHATFEISICTFWDLTSLVVLEFMADVGALFVFDQKLR